MVGKFALNCTEPVCKYSCVNGNCTEPDICTCDIGYEGTICSIPSCLTCLTTSVIGCFISVISTHISAVWLLVLIVLIFSVYSVVIAISLISTGKSVVNSIKRLISLKKTSRNSTVEEVSPDDKNADLEDSEATDTGNDINIRHVSHNACNYKEALPVEPLFTNGKQRLAPIQRLNKNILEDLPAMPDNILTNAS